jgi:hypothetical protein
MIYGKFQTTFSFSKLASQQFWNGQLVKKLPREKCTTNSIHWNSNSKWLPNLSGCYRIMQPTIWKDAGCFVLSLEHVHFSNLSTIGKSKRKIILLAPIPAEITITLSSA